MPLKPKRRGRPPKSEIKKREKHLSADDDEEDILLVLPNIFDDSDEESDSEQTSTEKSKKKSKSRSQNSDDDNMFTIGTEYDREGESDSSSETSSHGSFGKANSKIYSKFAEYERRIKELIKENADLKKKCKIVTRMDNKEVCRRVGSLRLINVNDGKQFVLQSKVDVECLHCRLKFDTVPCFIVDEYVDGVYYVMPEFIFCSHACAIEYNSTILNDYRSGTRNSLTKQIYYEIFGEDAKPLRPPEKTRFLKQCGGSLSKKQYRNGCTALHKEDVTSGKLKLPAMNPVYSAEFIRENNITETILD